ISGVKNLFLDHPVGHQRLQREVYSRRREFGPRKVEAPTLRLNHSLRSRDMRQPVQSLLILIVQLALVLGVSRIVGLLFAKLRQPQVMGEMIAGIMLGPS